MTESPRHGLDWTGERCVPWSPDIQVIYEHYHRYAVARDLCRGKRVLDLACGEGYGTALLATTATSVVGVDIDEVSIAHARRTYRSGNLNFRVGSMTNVSLLSEVPEFDVVVCFEAIEHVADHEAVLKLVRARLTDGGALLLSTPDAGVYQQDHGDNPFHVRELSHGELSTLLEQSFEHHRILRQQVATGSAIIDLTDASQPEGMNAYTLQRQDGGWQLDAGIPHTYLLAVASDSPVDALVPSSIMLDPDLTITHPVEALAQRDGLQRLYDGSRDEVVKLKDALRRAQEVAVRAQAEADRAVEHAQQAAVRAENEAVRARQATSEAEQRAAEAQQRATEQVRSAERQIARLTADMRAERRQAERLASGLTGLRHAAAESNHRAEAAERELLALRRQVDTMSPVLQRGLSRYRGTLERTAPRGTRRRDVYEVALGRQAGVAARPESDPPLPVVLPTFAQPSVSVIIPVHGKWAYTEECLRSLARAVISVPFEVIVVDDASLDETPARLADCQGVRIETLPDNLGFIGACNAGAAAANSDLLLFLNNDTQVMAGAIEHLVDTLDHHDDIGMVGAKLVYPNGQLQEAGGIIWADGTGWNYGRHGNPQDPAVNVLRDVDYVSGAAILVRRELFEQVDGFDARFAPAYYEDTDLAFAIRAAGSRVVVQPKAVVVHHEGISNGVDVTHGVKQYQELNRAVFCDKWAHELTRHLPGPSDAHLWLGRQRRNEGAAASFVLVVDHQVPSLHTDAGSVRMFEILRILVAQGRHVVFFPANAHEPPAETEALQQLGITVLAAWDRQAAFLREAGEHVSFALLSRPNVAWRYLEDVRRYAPQATVVYDTVDLHFVRVERQAAVAAAEGRDAEAVALHRVADTSRELELGLTRSCDMTLVVSDVEKAVMSDLAPGSDVRLLSLIYDIDTLRPSPDDRNTVLFVGSFDHPPNQDAAHWLATEIMPRVRQQVPDAILTIVGSHPKPETLALAGPGVEVHGDVPDLDPLFRRARVSAAPLRFGAGVKGKIVESVAHGVPVVTTSVGVEGICLTDEQDVLVADACDEFAACVVRLLRDDELWSRLSEAAQRSITAQFGRATADAILEQLLAVPATV